MTQYKWLPSEPTEEMLFALYGMYKTLEERYLAAWEAAPVVNQEPYAYATLWDDGEWSAVQDIEQNAIKQVPLYTHSQPKRKPLSEDELLVLLKNIDSSTKRLPIGFKLFARAVEKAQGVGV